MAQSSSVCPAGLMPKAIASAPWVLGLVRMTSERNRSRSHRDGHAG